MTLPEWAANAPVADLWFLVVFLVGVVISLTVMLIHREVRLLRTQQRLRQLQPQLQQPQTSGVHDCRTSPSESEVR